MYVCMYICMYNTRKTDPWRSRNGEVVGDKYLVVVVCRICQHTSKEVGDKHLVLGVGSIRQYSSVFVSIRHHTSVYVNMCQYTSDKTTGDNHLGNHVSQKLLIKMSKCIRFRTELSVLFSDTHVC